MSRSLTRLGEHCRSVAKPLVTHMVPILDWHAITEDPSRLQSLCNQSSFERLRCFHLCRTDDVASYYNQGVRLVSRDTLRQQFRDMFSDLPNEVIKSAIGEFGDYSTPQQVYVGVDCRFLLQHCGHYCIYGSEYLTALAVKIKTGDGQDHRQRLKTFGRPTVIVLEIPFEHLPPSDANGVIDELKRVASGDLDNVVMPNMLLDYGISFNGPLSCEWVVDHSHPESIWDPLLKEDYKCFA